MTPRTQEARSTEQGFSAPVYQDRYLSSLTAELRPRYGKKAPALAQAYVDFTNDRAPRGASWDVIEAHQIEARARFNERVRAIKSPISEQTT